MSLTAVCGVNWGDEGKGRMVDYLAQNADFVVRYQGGNNAGHTVVNNWGEFKLHLVPSGIFNPNVICVLGPGMVVDLEALVHEIKLLKAAGIVTHNIRISDRATICFPFHRNQDVWEEERLSEQAYGSTRMGIAPCYGDRYLKKGVQVGEIFYPKKLKERLQNVIDWKNLIAKGVYKQEKEILLDEVFEWTLKFGAQIQDLICNTTELLEKAVSSEKHILFEAQLGSLRDIVFGIYPYTSSSSSLAAFAPIGSGLPKHTPDNVIGVMKAFSTCIGEGPFVTEMKGDVASQLREIAYEYGAATGRPRRIGHFDAFASRYGAQLQGATEIALTKLDCLTGLESLKICTHYKVNGKQASNFPLVADLEIASPVYMEMQGWEADISKCKVFKDLPKSAQNYVGKIEELIEHPIKYISVGPERDSLMKR